MSGPLSGLVVADFSRVLAGPLATMTLADLGAVVIKVERPGSGDDTRSWGPPWGARSSSYFEGLNRSKYSIALDFFDPGDRATAFALAERADVVVQNLKLTRFGLDYESVAAVNPGVVYCSVTGFGAEADLPGYDFLVQAVGGLMSITGEAGGEPLKVGVALVDVLTAKDATIGILAALHRRRETGLGDHVQVDLMSSLLGGLVNQASGYLATGVAPGRMGNRHPSIAPYETLRCADVPIAVACGNDRQFARLCEVLGIPSLAGDARFRDNPSRVAHREALVALLEEALAGASAAVWEERLTAAGVAAGVVRDIGQAIDRAASLGLAPLVDGQIRHPVRYSSGSLPPPAAPPTVDEHAATVRGWLAGTNPLVHPGEK
ncbi:putative L-carnitine dehydratase [Actinoplanes ianthinogenes]|uniref:L-carnitine dehydratase n=1 Tax=Actinoplanes ianthinogenes TaxID=122358 RepID=A0ABM7M9S9_9ACTN|nr:CoA transferase [Actinoplanes ianthinogenes]BCJ48381.1 putative L-carnitine dehydratase [Actinoplanes ianthinogenes]GGR46770.1 putative L-carnitine dehydratase [Actinoplanes ianthinogenes]